MLVKNSSIKDLHYKPTVINFMQWDKLVFFISGVLFSIAIMIISICGFHWGLDFTGGTVIELHAKKPVHLDLIRMNLQKVGLMDIQVQNFDNSHDLIAYFPSRGGNQDIQCRNTILNIINHTLHEKTIVKRIEFVGPRVGSELLITGGIAILSALIAIFLYVSVRFTWRLALGTVFALIHDLGITIGFLSLCHIEIDLTILASLLSVVGYSLNDKIVVSDRIRENFRKISVDSSFDITNLSITQTFSRTIITSMITLMMVLILLIFGGIMLHGFSLTMLIGIIIGTISSIYVSSSLALKLGMKKEHMIHKKIDIATEGES
ncbi:Protein translocase subunit SecF [Candidatus Erwinia haradaeae]|uniref:Protein-export membrane protein SecF n=1 Tax=Candidatus Erwinia haradaeae TaxID=1922217 RepID=A0A451DD21_9GAMM|nr:protein translocase subunit SecF [Candidatus Erwinia haradaeae]VFP84336.1 Protein translocase subunit SecF [Candidatus Erwinia haradaeae]